MAFPPVSLHAARIGHLPSRSVGVIEFASVETEERNKDRLLARDLFVILKKGRRTK